MARSGSLFAGTALIAGAALGGAWAWQNYEVEGVRFPVSEETGEWQSPVIRAEPAAQTSGLDYDSYPLQDLQKISAELNKINKIVCPSETGLFFLRAAGSEIDIQVCADFRSTKVVSSSFDNTMINYLSVSVAPDPEAPIFMDWEESVKTIKEETCRGIADALGGFVIQRIESLDGQFEPNTPIQIGFSASEPASCGSGITE